MVFRGLFIGINRHESVGIRELSYARRDAEALHALFTDAMGGDTTLLVDEDATRVAIESGLDGLASAHDDVVVVTYSGHGTPTHELVAHDSDTRPRRNDGRISLADLGDRLARIPAKRLLCILDCCFAGGMGAKALDVEALSRDYKPEEALLDSIGGNGRVVLLASAAGERAFEYVKLRHGLLTYFVLAALRGCAEVLDAGKISVYRLLEYVTQRVIDYSTECSKAQHPGVRGTFEGDLQWPVFVPGARFRSLFPERARPVISEDVRSLAAYGFPDELLDGWAGAIPSLNRLQIDAINEFDLLEGAHLVVSAPTSSGKTMVGELAALKGAIERRRTLFLLPLKALVNDKLLHFNQVYGAFGIRTIKATGESTTDDMAPLLRGRYDICLMTYEKFAAVVLGNPHILDEVGTVVVDEVQMVADPSRGLNLEFILTLLRLRRHEGTEPQIIALSAVVGEFNGFERWLGARVLRRTERPVPLDEGILRADGSFRYVESDTGIEKIEERYVRSESHNGKSKDYIVPLARRLVVEGKSVIVFRETKGEARGCAGYLAETLGLPPACEALEALPAGDPSMASGRLRESLAGGIAFHVSDLDPEERRVVEEAFRAPNSAVRVIAATTTLAMGVNTPAEAVVIAGLMHPGEKPYSVAEYKSIAGRAGRLPFATRGRSLLLALSPHEEHYLWTHYVMGQPEDLASRFFDTASDVRSLVLRVLVAAARSGQGLDSGGIVGFLAESFGAFQRKMTLPQWSWDRTSLLEAIQSLRVNNLVTATPDGKYHLTEFGRFAGEAGVEVESVIRLAAALGAVPADAINDQTLVAATQLTVELDKVLFPINSRGIAKEGQTWVAELRRQEVADGIVRALRSSADSEREAALRAKKTVGCLLGIADMSMSQIEEVLTQHGGRFDGASGPVQGVRARTCDLLPMTVRVAELLHKGINLGDRTGRLLVRLETGVPPGAVDLATMAGTRLSRGDYRRLLRAGLVTLNALEACSDAEIVTALDSNSEKVSVVRGAQHALRRKWEAGEIEVPAIPLYEG